MSTRTFGIIAGVIGSAVGAWFWSRQRATASVRPRNGRDHGTVIFDNTPTAAEGGSL